MSNLIQMFQTCSFKSLQSNIIRYNKERNVILMEIPKYFDEHDKSCIPFYGAIQKLTFIKISI